MRRDPALGSAFMDLALAGTVLTIIGLIVDAVNGGGVTAASLLPSAVTLGAYLVGALRLGVSPIRYLANVWRRGRAYSVDR